MSFFSVLFALLIEQLKPLPHGNPVHEGLTAWMRWTARNFDAGKPHHAGIVWAITVILPSLAIVGVHLLPAGIGLDEREQVLVPGFGCDEGDAPVVQDVRPVGPPHRDRKVVGPGLAVEELDAGVHHHRQPRQCELQPRTPVLGSVEPVAGA